MGKTLSYRKLIEAVANSCKYHQYEVEDVLVHLSKVLQQELAKGNNVRLTGVGTVRMQKLKGKEHIDTKGRKVCYDSFRLSVVSDTSMKEYLKEYYVEPTDNTN